MGWATCRQFLPAWKIHPSYVDRDEAVLRFWSGVEVSISLSPFVLVRQHGRKLASSPPSSFVFRIFFFFDIWEVVWIGKYHGKTNLLPFNIFQLKVSPIYACVCVCLPYLLAVSIRHTISLRNCKFQSGQGTSGHLMREVYRDVRWDFGWCTM